MKVKREHPWFQIAGKIVVIVCEVLFVGIALFGLGASLYFLAIEIKIPEKTDIVIGSIATLSVGAAASSIAAVSALKSYQKDRERRREESMKCHSEYFNGNALRHDNFTGLIFAKLENEFQYSFSFFSDSIDVSLKKQNISPSQYQQRVMYHIISCVCMDQSEFSSQEIGVAEKFIDNNQLSASELSILNQIVSKGFSFISETFNFYEGIIMKDKLEMYDRALIDDVLKEIILKYGRAVYYLHNFVGKQSYLVLEKFVVLNARILLEEQENAK